MKSDTPAISVIMSVYNGEKYLAEAIESILNQTFSDFEFIIVDDGSTDSSLSIIQTYMKKDDRIVLISRDNKGLPYSLNEAISVSKGKYVARMDSDDISLLDRLRIQFNFMEKNPEIGVCGTWALLINHKNNKKIIKHPSCHEYLHTKLFFSVCFIHPSVIFRRDVLPTDNYIYNPEYTNSQDYELWARMSSYTRFSNIKKVLIKYRVNSQSITASLERNNNDLRFSLLKKIYLKNYAKNFIYPSDEIISKQYHLASNFRLMSKQLTWNEFKLFLDFCLDFDKKSNEYKSKLFFSLLMKKCLVWVFFNFKAKGGISEILKMFLSSTFWLVFLRVLK